MGNRYWKDVGWISDKLGNTDFILGVIEGVTAYATWKDGKQVVGCTQRPLEDVIKEIKKQLKWGEVVDG